MIAMRVFLSSLLPFRMAFILVIKSGVPTCILLCTSIALIEKGVSLLLYRDLKIDM